MADMVAIVYPSEQKAEQVRQEIFELQREYLLSVGDAVIATKTESGKVKLNQVLNTTAAGALDGSFWGLLIGAIFLMPIFGMALGAASGALGGALTDFGIDDGFMKQLASNVQPGNAVLFLLVDRVTTDKVLERLKGSGGVVLKTSLDRSKEQALRDAISANAASEKTA